MQHLKAANLGAARGTKLNDALEPEVSKSNKDDRYGIREMIRDRKGTPKNLCDKVFAELSGELSRVICLKTLVLLGRASNCSENSLVLLCDVLALGFFFGS